MVNPSLVLLLLASLASFDVAHEAGARHIFARLLAEGHYGSSHIERAAFLVRDSRGRLSAVDWPAAAGADSAEWNGAFPPGVVAIAHTHPNWLPRPSKIDSATARQARVPVYVITRTEIWKTTGEAPAAIAAEGWAAEAGAPRQASGGGTCSPLDDLRGAVKSSYVFTSES
jgi:hypothetical protein